MNMSMPTVMARYLISTTNATKPNTRTVICHLKLAVP